MSIFLTQPPLNQISRHESAIEFHYWCKLWYINYFQMMHIVCIRDVNESREREREREEVSKENVMVQFCLENGE